MWARGRNSRAGAVLLALAALLAPAQIAQANIDLPMLKEGAQSEPQPRPDAPVAAVPMARFVASPTDVELGWSRFPAGQSVASGLGEGHPRLRFAALDYRPYLPDLVPASRERAEAPPLGSDGTPVSIFGSVAISVTGSVHAGRWRQVLSEQAHIALSRPCQDNAQDCGGPLMQKARGVVREARRLERDAKVKLINSFVNGTIRYGTDRDIYGVADHWATLAETFARGRGDCEDIAIAKMWMLRAAGIDPADMHLSLGRQTRLREDHAILVVKAEPARNFYLDNLTSRVELAEGQGEFQPLLSYGARGAWIHGYKVTRRS